MRLAISGSHRVGKTTLVERIAKALPGYMTIDEPYYLLEDDGHECAEPPSLDDFEAQLERSLVALDDGEPDVVFDRCPVDILGYLLAHEDASAFDADDWLDRIRDAIATLDLIVFVPIEHRDRIAFAPHDDAGFRRAVHNRLCELLVEDALGLGAEVLIVHGNVGARVDQVMARLGATSSGSRTTR